MGIYTSNRFFGEAYDYASEIPANEAYDAAFGCAHILADCQKNDMALFEGAIYDDINEVRALQEGTGYVNENATFTNIIKKIVEWFKKLLGKIQGIIKSLVAKLDGAFRDNKKLVERYQKQISNCSNWKEFELKKIRVPKNENIIKTVDDAFATNSTSNNYKITLTNKNILNDLDLNNNLKTVDDIDAADADTIKLALINKYISGVDITDFSKVNDEVMSNIFNEENNVTSVTSSYFSKPWIAKVLIDSKDWLKSIKTFEQLLNNNTNNIIHNLELAEKAVEDFIEKNSNDTIRIANNKNDFSFGNKQGDTVDKLNNMTFNYETNKKGNQIKACNSADVQAAIKALQKIAGNENEVTQKVISEYTSVVKFTIAQARKIWNQAAVWSSNVHKESVEYYQALGEASAEEFYSNMESIAC